MKQKKPLRKSNSVNNTTTELYLFSDVISLTLSFSGLLVSFSLDNPYLHRKRKLTLFSFHQISSSSCVYRHSLFLGT